MLLERAFEFGRVSNLVRPFNQVNFTFIEQNDLDETLYMQSLEPEKQKTLTPVFLIERAITRLLMPAICPEIQNFSCFGFDKHNNFYCDYYDGTSQAFNDACDKGQLDFAVERHIVCKIEVGTNKLSGVVLDSYGGTMPYYIKTRTLEDKARHSASAAIFCILAFIISSVENGFTCETSDIIYAHYCDAINSYKLNDMGSFSKAILSLDADIYTLIQYPEKVESKFGKFTVVDNYEFNISNYTNPDLDMCDVSDIEGFNAIEGTSAILGGAVSKPKPKKLKGIAKEKDVAYFVKEKKYFIEDFGLSEQDELLIPKGFDNFVPNPITLDIAGEIIASVDDPIPARNFLLTGETGTGKSTETQMLAKLLNIPYRSMNLSSDKLSSDILTQCLPNHQKVTQKDIEELIKSFPDAETIAFDPVTAYTAITKKIKVDATEEDVNKAKSDAIFSLMSKANDFMYVDSPFVETYRNGGVIELQEVNACKAAILKSLNETMDDLNIIHLPTGEVVKRHKYCIICVTANVGAGYEGIQQFSNDFIARFHQADVFELPDDKTLANRVMLRSGYSDEKMVMKMVKVMHAIQRVLLETKGDYGSCSPRGLIAWARKTKNCGDAYLAGIKTIVGLATQDPEIRVELVHALETEFAPKI